jgi:SAM-dependent methyltransferase
MHSKNIKYKTDRIAAYYGAYRNKCTDYYDSERWIFDKVAGTDRRLGRVLDVGCAVGGLGFALSEHYLLTEYVGVDINSQAIEIARTSKSSCQVGMCRFECGDILEVDTIPVEGFDNVFSLSCADWNVMTIEIINRCWRYVAKGGHFILTLRLTSEASRWDISESFQYICFGNEVKGCMEGVEKAPYVVLNVNEALTILSQLDPKPTLLVAYGYWGQPSLSARTPYQRLCFTALAVKKGNSEEQHVETVSELHLPTGLLI